MVSIAQVDSALCTIKVIDRRNKKPIDSALVKIFSENQSNPIEYKTDSNGDLKLFLVFAKYKVEIDKVVKEEIYLGGFEKIRYISKIYTMYITKDLLNPFIFEAEKVTAIGCGGVEKINFDYGNDFIRPDAKKDLKQLASLLRSNPKIRIEIVGHIDCRELKKEGIALAEKRSIAVQNYFRDEGISPERFSLEAFSDRYLNECNCKRKKGCGEEQYQENRRVEFKILSF